MSSRLRCGSAGSPLHPARQVTIGSARPTQTRSGNRTAMESLKATRWIGAILFGYALGFSLFYPEVFTSADEPSYVAQAAAFASRSLEPVSAYPAGASLLQV